MKNRILSALTVLILLFSLSGIGGCAKKPSLLSVTYDGGYLGHRYAYEWTQMLVDTVDALDASEVGVYEGKLSDEYYRIELSADATVGSGNWRIERVNDRLVRVYAADGYGFIGASRYFAEAWEQSGSYTAEIASGSYLQTLSELEGGTAYAYNRQGEVRVMFYNVLWGEPTPDERNQLNAETVRRYLPDVLGLQEMNKSKRGNTQDGKGGLIAELEALGYVEAIDPRVKNLYGTEERIPGTDASLTTDVTEHTELYGYGTKGGTEVTVNGETFYTFFNCAPLLYNAQTTRLIAADYYWYRNQWDKRTGQKHENGATDCASKAATWGVFENLATGERYIAISTHMCTRSDYVRGLQGQEMVELIERLSAEYDCPIILGGDYNGTYTSANYRIFEQNGMIDVEKNGLATVYTSKTRGHHTYPAFNEEAGLTLPASGDNTGTAGSDKSVDHIMLANVEEGELTVGIFALIIDDCTMSGADHFPMVMDFTING